MKNLLKLHENLVIFPLKFSQDFHGFWFHSASKFKKSSNKNSLSVEICATVISSEGYDYENRNKVRYK